MRPLAAVVLLMPVLAAASGPTQPQAQPLDAALAKARAEQAAAEAETARLEKVASDARDDAAKLRGEQAAAAQAIEAAEARITSADMQLRLAAAYVAAHRARLEREQLPVSALLAGLAVMAQRPPLLALADGQGSDDLVKIGVLLDSTLPVIRSRTQALSAQLAEGQRLESSTVSARAELVRSRENLANKQRQFEELEKRAIERSLAAGGQALRTGDTSIAAGERADRLRQEQVTGKSARQLAEFLVSEEPAPARPFAPAGQSSRPPFAYILPADARVVEGLGEVNDSGVRSRGISLASVRGTALVVPADGIVRFSGPYRDYDGILILDHGGGWMSLIVNISSPLKGGDQVRLGQPLGRALGPITVDLSRNGQRFSPALIAGSSQSLSKAMKGG